FFFSSRRRHTRSKRDWSSDVCSSDLQMFYQLREHQKRNQTQHLILVSGVPGAGKTFVGLNLAHTMDNAVYLSGNGPLVDVLQDRSEERRVGKECRMRVLQDDLKL